MEILKKPIKVLEKFSNFKLEIPEFPKNSSKISKKNKQLT
jgi:hypothetical protein